MSFDATVCSPLPLADATLHLLNYLASEDGESTVLVVT
jgi:hypothetical protein